MSIHKKIKEGRARVEMTEQQFADAVGVSRSAIQQWEKEGGTAPKRGNQPAVAKLLGISVAELMGGTLAPGDTVVAPDDLQGALEIVRRHLSGLEVHKRVTVGAMLMGLAQAPDDLSLVEPLALMITKKSFIPPDKKQA